eukprot:741738-Prymnesium_polylepis.1
MGFRAYVAGKQSHCRTHGMLVLSALVAWSSALALRHDAMTMADAMLACQLGSILALTSALPKRVAALLPSVVCVCAAFRVSSKAERTREDLTLLAHVIAAALLNLWTFGWVESLLLKVYTLSLIHISEPTRRS